MEKKCSECVWSIHQDYGYSNWTVEGTNVSCGKNLNPNMPFDRWYGEDARDLFAETCNKFIFGDGVDIDCDSERTIESNDPEVFWSEYLNGYVTGKMIEGC